MTNPTKSKQPHKPMGRPQKMADGKRINVYLDSVSLARADKLGDGNVSAGIRTALRESVPGVQTITKTAHHTTS